MPSTYTTNNGLEKPGSGEQSGTWDDTLNDNFDFIDTALDGQVTVTLPSVGTSGSPNDLTITDGTASDGRNRYVEFNDGGDLGGTAYVRLVPNDAEKIMIVKNSLSGSRSILLFQGTYNSANDYELSNGDTKIVKFDGGGTGAVVELVDLSDGDVYTPSNVSITGGSITGITDLAVADGGTGASTAADARTNLGLGTISTQAANNVSITGGAISGITDLAVADGGTGASTASGARTNLGLVIGTDVQAWDADLDSFSGKTAPSGDVVGTSDTQTLTNKTLTAAILQDGLVVDTNTANWTGTETLDPVNGLYQEITLTGNVTSVTDSLADGESIILAIADGTAYTITWPTITWISDEGVAPTLQTSGYTIITVWKSGSTLYGLAANGA